MSKKILSTLGIGVAVAVVALIASGPVKAADFIAPNGDDGTVTINQTETHHNLYIAGGDVSVNSRTTGDLYAAGGWVSVDGPVEQDVVVAAGTTVISEPVNGDVRVAGGKVTINAPVKGDVLVGAGTLVLTDKASVGGELRASGGSVVVNSPVEGGVFLMGGTITLNSKINGSVKVTANKQLIFGSSADITNDVFFVGRENAVMNDGARVHGVNFTELKQHQRDNGKRTGVLGFLLGTFLIQFFGVVLAGLLLIRLLPTQTLAVAENMLRRPWANLGIGFVTAIFVPIALVIVLVLVVGYFIAFVVGAAYLLAALVAILITSIFIGALIVKLLTKKPNLVLDWQAVVIGAVVAILLKLIPVVGWLLDIGIFLIAFGAVVSVFWQFVKRSRGTKVQPEDSINN